MKQGLSTLHIGCLIFFGAWLFVQPSYSENTLDFYKQNSALTVYSEEASTTNLPEINYYEAKKAKSASALSEKLSAAVQENSKNLPLQLPKTKDDILKTFGDPENEVMIPGREDAPAPFKAMMASIELGDTELAQKYARQYVKYIKKVQNKTDTVMTLVNRAMGSEGLIKPNDTESNAEQKEQPKTEPFDEDTARADTRAALAGQVSKDPFGEVDVYFFFKMDDQNSRLMIPEIEAFYNSIKDDPKIRFVALSLDNATREDIEEYTETFGIKFPIRGGINLAKKLNVSAVPATIVMTHNAPQKAVTEKGFRRAFYLEELTFLMQGKEK